MAIAGGDGHDVVHVATAVIATQADGVALALGGVVAQLAVVVAAPGVDDTGVAQGHGEVVAGGNLDNVLQAVDAAGTGVVEAVDQHRHSAVGCGGVAQLAVGVIAPGVDVALGGHGKAVVAAGGDVGDLHALGELDLDHIALADLGSVVTHTAGLKGRAVAQLAVLVVAPGPDGAVGLEGQGEVPSGGHHGHRHRLLEGQHGDEHRTGVGDTGGILAGEVDDDPAIGVRTGGLDRPGTVALALHGGDAGIGAGEGHVAGIGAQLGIAVKVKAFIAHRVHEVLAEDVAVAVPHGDGQRRLVEAVFDVLDGLGAVLAVEPGVGRLQGTVLLGAHLQGPVALAGGEITQLGGGIFAPGQGEALPVDRHAVGGAGADALGCVEIGVLRGGTIVVVAPDDRRGRQDLLDGGGGAAAGILNTQLAHVVAAPGVDTALVVHEHGELPTGTDGHNAVQVTCGLVQILVQADGAHLYGQTVAFGGAVAQLAVGVGAPGVDLGTLGHHSAVFHRRLAAQAQGEGAAHVGPDQVLEGVGGVGEVVVPIIVGGLGGETGHGLIHGEGIALVERGGVGGLPVVRLAPHVEGTVGPEGCVGVAADGDGDDVAEVAAVVVTAGEAAHADAHPHQLRHPVGAAGGGEAVATLTQAGVAPAEDGAVLQEGQGVALAHGDLHHAGEVALTLAALLVAGIGGAVKGVPEGAVAGQHPHRISGVGGGAGAQLAIGVVAPGEHVTVGREGHGVVVALGDDLLADGDGDDGVVVGGADIAQQAGAAHAQHLHGRVVVGGVGLGHRVVSSGVDVVDVLAEHIRDLAAQRGVGGEVLDVGAGEGGLSHIDGGLVGHLAHSPVHVNELGAPGEGAVGDGADVLAEGELGEHAAGEGHAVGAGALHTQHLHALRGGLAAAGEEGVIVGLVHLGGQGDGGQGLADLGQSGDNHRAAAARELLEPGVEAGCGLAGGQVVQLGGGVVLPGKGGDGGGDAGGGVHAQQSGGIVAPGPDGAVALDGEGDTVAGVDRGVGDDGHAIGIGSLGVDGDGKGAPVTGTHIHGVDDGGAVLGLGGTHGSDGNALSVSGAGNGDDALVGGEPVEVLREVLMALGAAVGERTGGGDSLAQVEAGIVLLGNSGGIHGEALAAGELHPHGQRAVCRVGSIADGLAPLVAGRVVEDVVLRHGVGVSGGSSCGHRAGGDLHEVGRPAAGEHGGVDGGGVAGDVQGAAGRAALGVAGGDGVIGGAVAHLAVLVAAPAVDITVGSHDQVGVEAGGEAHDAGEVVALGGRVAAEDLDGCHAHGDLGGLVGHAALLAITQRAVDIVAPGPDPAIGGEGQVVVGAGADGHDVGSGQGHLGGLLPNDVLGIVVVVAVVMSLIPPVTAVVVGAPGVDRAVGGEGHGVGVAGVDGDDAGELLAALLAAGDGNGDVAVLPVIGVGGGVAGIHGTLAQLIAGGKLPALVVVAAGNVGTVAAPDEHGAVRAQSHGELIACGDGHHLVQVVVAVGLVLFA